MVLFIITVCAYLLTALIFYPLTFLWPFKARVILTCIISFYSRIGLLFMGVTVRTSGKMNDVKNSFVVCNHLGYLDILVMASKLRASFVTSLEMRQTPFLGQLCEMGGCLYVDRRTRANLSREVEMLTEALKSGLNVCVFPEGTSGDGSEVLRFKRPLFRSAIDANAKTSVMCLNYVEINGEAVSTRNRDSLFWYGDMSFLPHLWNFFKCKSVIVELDFLAQLAPESDYVVMSEKAHERVSSHFKIISSGPKAEPWIRAPLVQSEVQPSL